jgi:hypothetical protein
VAHQAELGLAFVTDYTNLRNDWKNKFTTQQQQIGLVKDADSQTDTNRDAVEVLLMVNVLVIASRFVGQPEMVNDFFNQQLLERHSSGGGGSENTETFEGGLPAGATVNVDISELPLDNENLRFEFENAGGTIIRQSFGALAGAAPGPGVPFNNINPGVITEKLTLTEAGYDSLNRTFLNMTNLDVASPGSYRVIATW